MTDLNETTELTMKADRCGRLRDTAQQKQLFIEALRMKMYGASKKAGIGFSAHTNSILDASSTPQMTPR